MAKTRCEHCGLSYDESVLIDDTSFSPSKKFCCKGCQGVFHLLHDSGLDSFYTKKGKATLNPPQELADDLSKFDLDGFTKKYVKEKDGLCEVSLVISGIHCSACIWLNEKVLHKSEGIVEVNISEANHKAKIVWDKEATSLSSIIAAIRSIGYNAYPYDAKLQEERINAERREYYAKLIVGICTTMNIMWIAIAQYSGYFTGMERDTKNILIFAEFLLATPTLFYTGSVFYKGAYYGLKHKYLTMDLLVATGATLAYIYSMYVMFSGKGEPYFDSVTMIITFVFAGKYFEVLMRKRAVDTLDMIAGTLPNEVLIVKNNEKVFISIENVEVGDIIEVKAGEKIVIDGICVSGEGSFDEASLTGESIPVLKKMGDKITSGTICLDSVMRYKASVRANESTIHKITTILEDAMTKKPRIEQLANQISRKFSATILSIAFLTLLGWWYFSGFERALIVAISVVVIACPCALALATPVATLVGLGVGAKRGVLFKETKFLEEMSKCDVLVLDKTGTITKGKPEVTQMKTFKEFDVNVLYSLAKNSLHPVSKGVANYLEKTYESVKEVELLHVKNIEAKGIEASFKNQKIIGGNARFINEFGFTCKDDGGTSYWFAIDDTLCAKFTLKDTPREDSKEAIKDIKNLGIEVVMLTGDNEIAAKEIAKEVGIEKFYSSLLPLQKAEFVENLKQNGRKVVMAGDGINDTIALAKSDIAISIGSGADIAVNVSDVVLMDDSLRSIYNAFLISKRTFRGVRENIIFSIGYNIITIPLAIAGFVIPLIAALSMSLSSILVILNALRIKNVKGVK
ncbi:MAG: heavy metal translocating P-type ATPase [Campylobacteraceae bacterium]